MPVIRACKTCGRKNRTPAKHLADAGQCGACKSSLPPVDEPLEVDSALFDEIIQNARVPVLVDFWAAWCAPCRALAPTIDSIAEEYKGRVKVGKLDVDANGSTAARFNIRGIPTLLVIKDGQVKEQIVGAVDKGVITKALDKHL